MDEQLSEMDWSPLGLGAVIALTVPDLEDAFEAVKRIAAGE